VTAVSNLMSSDQASLSPERRRVKTGILDLTLTGLETQGFQTLGLLYHRPKVLAKLHKIRTM
jgi:hypothetical protein